VTDTVPYPDVPWIRENMPEHLLLDDLAGTYFVYFNFEVPAPQDVRVRRALSLAIDRETLTAEVTEGLNRPASGWVPAGIPGADASTGFCDVSGELVPVAGSPEEARRLLAEAGFPGGQGFPALTYTYNTLDVNRHVAERLQAIWRRELGIEVNLINQEWQVLISSLRDGNYELGRFAWIADYADPMTFLDIWMSEDGNNRGRYRSPAYDALVREAMQTSDREAYFAICHQAERMLIDDAALIPIWFTRSAWLGNPALEGVLHTPTGDMLFHRARWSTERLAGDAGGAAP
jgi:oligopeptide transport system substrate-binding protein